MNNVFDRIEAQRQSGRKQLAVLIDPDKATSEQLSHLCELFRCDAPEILLVGGSLVSSSVDRVVEQLRQLTSVPIVLFPGNAAQLSPLADAVLLLSLISGRNPEYLIGQHVSAAPIIRQMKLETIATGYMLIDGGVRTSVEYVSNTQPIPSAKTDIAAATAMAGQMLGMRMLYLEAGSGAATPVSQQMIQSVRRSVDIPIVVGGGLRSATDVVNALTAGADMVVVGTALETCPDQYLSICSAVHGLAANK